MFDEEQNISGETKKDNKCICTVCGREIESGAIFCTFCGSPVDNIKKEIPVIPPPKPRNLTKVIAAIAAAAVFVTAAITVPLTIHLAKAGKNTLANQVTADKKEKTEDRVSQTDADSQTVDSVNKDQQQTEEKNEESSRKFDAADDYFKNFVDIERINLIIKNDANKADVSVYIWDLKNDVSYSTENAGKKMSASALINIPIIYTAEKCMEDHTISWDSSIRFKYLFSGRESIKSSQNGMNFDLRYLLGQLLNYSDNNAANSLIDYFGASYIRNICYQNGYTSVDIQKYVGESASGKDNYLCAADAVNMLKELYNSNKSYGINADYLKANFYIADDLKYDGIGRNIPSDTIFLNHNAVTSTLYNEIAIILSDKAEYIIAVMANNGKRETSEDTAAKISDYVYSEMNR